MSGSDADNPATSVHLRVRPDPRVPAVVQCRVPGAQHLRVGKPCQDAIGWARVGDIVALAVADGHGTSARGDVGAVLAVSVAVEQLLRFASELRPEQAADPGAVYSYARHPLRVHLVRDWADRVRRHAGAENAELELYGSTLLFALASPTYLVVGQIGDGDILLVDSARLVTRPIAPDPNNFADETTSLCQNEAWTAIRVRATPAPDGEALLLLSTDGYSKSYATDAVFELIGPDYLDMFREHGPVGVEQQLREILEAVSSGGSGDDIALGMLHWPPSVDAATSQDDAAPGAIPGSDDACGSVAAGAGDVAPSSAAGLR